MDPLPSPKVVKAKFAPPSTSSTLALASFGCGMSAHLCPLSSCLLLRDLFRMLMLEQTDHVQSLLNTGTRQIALQQHSLIQQTIFDRPNASQTHKSRVPEGRPSTSLTPVYLCLQCNLIVTPDGRDKHFETKQHAFCMGFYHEMTTMKQDKC